jgi:PIN domain nuclease of toxin-antitoxin system
METREGNDTLARLSMSVTAKHAAAVAMLPLHHSDPFDRLLLAQVFLEPLRFVTADKALVVYGGAIDRV